jgi:hypothetical protein
MSAYCCQCTWTQVNGKYIYKYFYIDIDIYEYFYIDIDIHEYVYINIHEYV